MAHAAEELDLVLLEPHARAAAVSQPAPRELFGDVIDEDGQSGGQALDGDHQRRSVGLARRQEPQHGASWGSGALAAPPSRRSDLRDSTAGPDEFVVLASCSAPRVASSGRRSAPVRRVAGLGAEPAVPVPVVPVAMAAAGWLKIRPAICADIVSPTKTDPGCPCGAADPAAALLPLGVIDRLSRTNSRFNPARPAT